MYAAKATLSHLFCIPAATDPKEADIIWVSMQVDSEVENALGLTDQQYTDPKEPEPVRMNACFFP